MLRRERERDKKTNPHNIKSRSNSSIVKSRQTLPTYKLRWISKRSFCILVFGILWLYLFLALFDEKDVFLFHPSTEYVVKDVINGNSSLPFPEEENISNAFYNSTWPDLKNVLCVEGVPNLRLAPTIFQLARYEVFRNCSFHGCDENRDTSVFVPTRPIDLNTKDFRTVDGRRSNFLRRFYSGDFGATVFHGFSENDNGDDSRRPFVTIYARIFKCGNDQIRSMEQRLFDTLEGKYTKSSLPKAMLFRLPRIYQPNQKRNKQIIPPPCIYTAIRDPISHFLSGYNELEVRQLGEYNNKSSASFPTEDKRAPYHLLVPYSSDSHELRKKRFQAFVEDVLLEEEVFTSDVVYSHFFPMSRILVALKKFNTSLSGYIPDLANLTSTWPEFMSSTCPNFPKPELIPKMTEEGQHASSKDRLKLYKAAKDVWAEAGPISRALCLLHLFDYACFDDLPGGIPLNPCQSVYLQYSKQIIKYGSRRKTYRHSTKPQPPPWSEKRVPGS